MRQGGGGAAGEPRWRRDAQRKGVLGDRGESLKCTEKTEDSRLSPLVTPICISQTLQSSRIWFPPLQPNVDLQLRLVQTPAAGFTDYSLTSFCSCGFPSCDIRDIRDCSHLVCSGSVNTNRSHWCLLNQA